ncbi:MAG: aldehyde ferredoxin oxidoreductase family protein [Deltaproteobacteria bacterium]|nr:aldehyde ferredoxin oxidoreductase family protein [Deltaproteobacteria bacterium]
MTTPRGGNFGKVLEIDLSKKTFKTRTVSEDIYQKFLGGAGMGDYFLLDEYKSHKDPFAEDSFLYLGAGPLDGTYCPSTRMSVVNMSPYTKRLSHAEVGAHIGAEIKWAGWDGIYIRGKSKKPVWLYIRNDKVEFRDAGNLWGKDTSSTEDMITEELSDPRVRIACIGPAGENEVLYAALIVERFRAAARTSTGALMGNKKLKAIAIKGTGYVPAADNDRFLKAAKAAKQYAVDHEGWQGIKRWGTAGLLELKNWGTGSLITKNYQTTWFPDVAYIGAEEASRRFWKRNVACTNCPVHCQKLGVIRGGKYSGLIGEGPEYETGGLLGSNVGVSEFDGMMAAIELCDALGLDAISTGGSIGFAMECVQRGVLSKADLDGIDLEWGNADAVVEMVQKIAYKNGKAGKLLSKGVAAMAKEIGHGSEKWASHTKGKEMAAHDPRGDKPRGVSYAMGQCGGDHHEANSPAGQAKRCLHNSLVTCSFVGGYWSLGMFTDMLNPLCGWRITGDDLMKTGQRIRTLERCFDVREGISRKDDVLPYRMMNEHLPEGPKKGAIFSQAEMKKVQDDYYAYFGWDNNGIPTEKTLKNLGLEFAIDDVREAKKAL